MSPVQRPKRRPPARPLQDCLGDLKNQWQQQGSIGALWQAWPELAGPQLAPHCRPLELRGRTLVVGAAQPQWLQALRYSRHQLLAVLQSRGYRVQTLQFVQQDAPRRAEPFSQELQRSWEQHPCRDAAAGADCPRCQAPTPAGELRRWGCCALCLRQDSSVFAPPPGWTGEELEEAPSPMEQRADPTNRNDGRSTRG